MEEDDRGAAPSPELLRIALESSDIDASTATAPHTALNIDQPGRTSISTSVKHSLLSGDTKPPVKSLDVQSRDLLALFENAVSAAIDVDMRNSDSSIRDIVQELDDFSFELRTLIENIENAVPKQYSPGEGLKLLDALGGSAASSLRLVLDDLEKNVEHLLACCSDLTPTTAEEYRQIRDNINAAIERLDELQDLLTKEIQAGVLNDYNIFDEHDATKTLSVLCLDGGGVRSYSSLLILKALMDTIRSIMTKDNRADNASETVRPCDAFDYIFGSSSGGILAIMLSRLKMIEEKCSDTFLKHTKNVFSHPSLRHNVSAHPKYSQKRLVEAVKNVIREFSPDPESEKWKRNIFAAPGHRCGCGVTAWDPELPNADVPHIFRTYDSILDLQTVEKASNSQIWQVALATSATPGYFPPINIDDQKFLDGGIGTYNPSYESFLELSKIHKKNPLCFVSIGCGKRRSISKLSRKNSFRSSFHYLQAAKELVTDGTTVHRNMLFLADRTEKLTYFRFDVPGLESVALDEWTDTRRTSSPGKKKTHTVDFIKNQTEIYLKHVDTQASIYQCAQAIVDSYFKSRDPGSLLSAEIRLNAADRGPMRHFLVPERNNAFYGRESILAYIEKYLTQTTLRRGAKLRCCVLSGMGGAGKSQIALEYSYRRRDDYDLILWAPASSQNELQHSYDSIVANLSKSEFSKVDLQIKNNQVEILKSWLSKTDKRWLLILDNVDDVQGTASYLPLNAEGSVILTTRRENLNLPNSYRIFVRAIETPQSMAVLSKPEDASSYRNVSSSIIRPKAGLGLDRRTDVTEAWEKANLLSFDGGGVRGYWSLLVVNRLMQCIARIERGEDKKVPISEKASHSFHPEEYPEDLFRDLVANTGRTTLKSRSPGADASRELKYDQCYLPCHYFDYICGSGTGSLIAIMLGRFRMTVSDCILEYDNLTLQMFGKPRLLTRLAVFGVEKYNTNNVEKAFREVVRRRCDFVDRQKDSIYFPSRRKLCQSFVTALVSESKDGPSGRLSQRYLIRSYDMPEPFEGSRPSNFSSLSSIDTETSQQTATQYPLRRINYGSAEHMEVWQVARAATAAPQYFKPFDIPSSSDKDSLTHFFDGGLLSKNPTWEGVQEIWDLNGPESLNTVLSVGAAMSYQIYGRSGKKTRRSMTEMGSDPERIHEQVQWESRDISRGFQYFRLDSIWSSNVAMDEYEPRGTSTPGSKTFEKMRSRFNEWADTVEQEESFRRIALLLVKQRRLRTLDKGRWETYSTGSIYRCYVSTCEDSLPNRFDFREHMNKNHGVKMEVDDERIKQRREIWQYQPKST